MFRTYALDPATVRRFLRRVFWRFQLIVTVSFLIFGVYLAWFSGPVRWSLAGPVVIVVALAYFFIIFFHYRQQMRLYYSQRYELDGSSITYRQVWQAPLRINRADIRSAEERPGGLWIETIDPRQGLLVPFGLARSGDNDFMTTLQAWVGVKKREHKESNGQSWLVLLGAVMTALILLFANTLWLIAPLGLMMLGYGLYAERRLNKTPDVSPGVVRMYSMAFSFLVFIIVMKSCLLGFLTLIR